MAEPEDLLGKADALMARHRPGQAVAPSYPEIPVLEEVVNLLPGDDDVPLLIEVVEPARAAPMPPDQALLHEEQVAALAQSRRATLLAALQPEVDRLIEERLKEGLEPLIVKLFEDMRGELQSIAHATLSDAIHAAVDKEIERHESRG